MKKYLLLTLFTFTIIGTGCVAKKGLMIIDGSKSAGTFTLAMEYGQNFWGGEGSPKVKTEEARQKAISKCKQWGYSDAELFEAGVSECVSYFKDRCNKWRYTVKCQCID